MFNSDLKDRVSRLEKRQQEGVDYLLARVREQERDFRLLLGALNMEVRKEEEFKVPRHIIKRPDPVAQECCSIADPTASLTTTEIRLADIENELSSLHRILSTLEAPPHKSYQDGTATYAQGVPAPVKAAKRRKKSKGKR